MRNHLLYKHPLIYSQKDKTAKDLGEKQSNLDTVIKARVCSEDKAKKITNCILNFEQVKKEIELAKKRKIGASMDNTIQSTLAAVINRSSMYPRM